jgi:hypothetical protein
MTCSDCADNRLSMRVAALKLAVEGASVSHKIDFKSTADSYFNWLMKSTSKTQKGQTDGP